MKEEWEDGSYRIWYKNSDVIKQQCVLLDTKKYASSTQIKSKKFWYIINWSQDGKIINTKEIEYN